MEVHKPSHHDKVQSERDETLDPLSAFEGNRTGMNIVLCVSFVPLRSYFSKTSQYFREIVLKNNKYKYLLEFLLNWLS